MRQSTLHLAVLGALALAGLAAAAYVLTHEGAGLLSPFASTYTITAQLEAVNGLTPGMGQPVDVAGVQVGDIVGVSSGPGLNPLVRMRIDRHSLPRVYANATAQLQPITPLEDLRIDLSPGGPPAPPLHSGTTIPLAQTATPTPLSTLLASLDADTRAYLTALIDSLGEGTAGRGPDLRRALLALGATASQLRLISTDLAARRTELARLVHNLALVAGAASEDRQLAAVVRAGDQTLSALAGEDQPLAQALSKLPPTLASADQTLRYAAQFADEVRPTVQALEPTIRLLPGTLGQLQQLADTARPVLARRLVPLVHRATPLAGSLGVALPRLSAAAPRLTDALQTLTYGLNEFTYNAGGGDQGGLFWFDWFVHNWMSFMSARDAHGAVARSVPFVDCAPLERVAGEVNSLVLALFDLTNLCPAK